MCKAIIKVTISLTITDRGTKTVAIRSKRERSVILSVVPFESSSLVSREKRPGEFANQFAASRELIAT